MAFPNASTGMTYDDLKELLLLHLKLVNFEAAERVTIHSLVHQEDQSIREFILQLQAKVSCERFQCASTTFHEEPTLLFSTPNFLTSSSQWLRQNTDLARPCGDRQTQVYQNRKIQIFSSCKSCEAQHSSQTSF